MRTRTLLLLAVACGLAILAAGVGLFVRLGDQQGAEEAVGAIGSPVVIGDLRVTVERYDEAGDSGSVVLTVGGVDDPDGTADFRLVTPGAALAPTGAGAAGGTIPPCAGTSVDERRCALVFDLTGVEGTARVLVVRRGDEQVRWPLGG